MKDHHEACKKRDEDHHEACKKRDEAAQAMMQKTMDLMGVAVRQITELTKRMAERDEAPSARKSAKNVNKTKKAGDFSFQCHSSHQLNCPLQVLIFVFISCTAVLSGKDECNDHHFNWIRGQGAGPRVGQTVTEQQRKFAGYRTTLRGHTFWFIYNALPAELDAYVLFVWPDVHMHSAPIPAILLFTHT
jgi:hypothetical protein